MSYVINFEMNAIAVDLIQNEKNFRAGSGVFYSSACPDEVLLFPFTLSAY